MSLDTSYIYSQGNTTTGNVTNTTSTTKGKSDLDMTDFLQLMVQQMKNQDINSSMDTSEYINQLSQYTMIQAVTEMVSAVKNGFSSLQEMTLSTYSMSMIGKEATVAVENETTGELTTITGTIEGVTYYNGSPMVIIDGEQYDITSVMGLAGATSNTATQLAQAAIDAANAATKAAGSATDAANSNLEMANSVKEMVNNVLKNGEESEKENEAETPVEQNKAQPDTSVSEDATILAAEAAAAQRLAEEN